MIRQRPADEDDDASVLSTHTVDASTGRVSGLGVLESVGVDRAMVVSGDDADVQQAELFRVLARPLLFAFLNGNNASIVVTGGRSSGKTHAVIGSGHSGASFSSRGMIPRALAVLDQQTELARRADPRLVTETFVSALEIVNDHGKDLLAGVGQTAVTGGKGSRVELVKDPKSGGWVLNNLSKVPVLAREPTSAAEAAHGAALHDGETSARFLEAALTLLYQAEGKRAADHSGHFVFSIHLRHLKRQDGQMRVVRKSSFKFFELASPGGTGGDEAIRTDLKAVMSVLRVLQESPPRETAVPYRARFLTSILRETLGGNSLTTFLGTLSPYAEDEAANVRTVKLCQAAMRAVNTVTPHTPHATIVYQDTEDAAMVDGNAEREADAFVLRNSPQAPHYRATSPERRQREARTPAQNKIGARGPSPRRSSETAAASLARTSSASSRSGSGAKDKGALSRASYTSGVPVSPARQTRDNIRAVRKSASATSQDGLAGPVVAALASKSPRQSSPRGGPGPNARRAQSPANRSSDEPTPISTTGSGQRISPFRRSRSPLRTGSADGSASVDTPRSGRAGSPPRSGDDERSVITSLNQVITSLRAALDERDQTITALNEQLRDARGQLARSGLGLHNASPVRTVPIAASSFTRKSPEPLPFQARRSPEKGSSPTAAQKRTGKAAVPSTRKRLDPSTPATQPLSQPANVERWLETVSDTGDDELEMDTPVSGTRLSIDAAQAKPAAAAPAQTARPVSTQHSANSSARGYVQVNGISYPTYQSMSLGAQHSIRNPSPTRVVGYSASLGGAFFRR